MRNLRGVAQCVNGACCTMKSSWAASGDNGGAVVSPPPYPLSNGWEFLGPDGDFVARRSGQGGEAESEHGGGGGRGMSDLGEIRPHPLPSPASGRGGIELGGAS
jgi:hypothetical protein